MLDWSDAKYKMTLGAGALAMAGMMAELWGPVLSVWCVLAVALLPFMVFIFIRPGEMNARFVRYARMSASLWYLIVAVVLLAALLITPQLPQGWLAFQVFVLIGSIPCWLVLFGQRG